LTGLKKWVAAQALGHAFGDRTERDSRGIGAEDRPVAAHCLDARKERAFGFQVLDDRFADPCARARLGQVPIDDDALADRHPIAPVGYGSVKRDPVRPELLEVRASGPSGPVIGAIENSLLTERLSLPLPYKDGVRSPDREQGVHKLCVLERHGKNGNVGRGFVKGFGALRGALAGSVGHDSHNLIVVGDDDADMALAVNRLIELQGGYVAAQGARVLAELPLPIAGLMSDRPFEEVARQLRALRGTARDLGCALAEPFLQLAFLPLPVIPHLKLTDRGLVDVDRFELIAA
jgi:adenine deaminase